MFSPRIELDALDPVLTELHGALDQVSALDLPPLLERWLRQEGEARSAHMSTRIEGNTLSEQEVRELLRRTPVDPSREELENLNYRDASRLVKQVSGDFTADIDGGLIRGIHFLAVHQTDRYGSAGQYRTEQNAIVGRAGVIYLPPQPSDVRRLMDDLVAWLRENRRQIHPLVLAAVAHTELVGIHPFDDGNGRTARLVMRYFMQRHAWNFRDVVSPEHVLGTRRDEYFGHLRAIQGARYPGQSVDLTPWVQWFLSGLATEVAGRVGAVEGWRDAVKEVSATLALSERQEEGLAAIWLMRSVSSGEYEEALRVAHATAVSDLNLFVRLGMLERVGRGRATRYVATLAPLDDIVDEGRRAAIAAWAARIGRHP